MLKMCRFFHLHASFGGSVSSYTNAGLLCFMQSYLSACGLSHAGWLFSSEEQKTLAHDIVDTFATYLYQPCSWLHWYRLLGTKQQHEWRTAASLIQTTGHKTAAWMKNCCLYSAFHFGWWFRLEMYVSVFFVIRCLYSAVTLTLVREQCSIRIIYYCYGPLTSGFLFCFCFSIPTSKQLWFLSSQIRERMRIQQAGGFVSFNGVWRVAGVLATSRALGDLPLKEKNFLIADPDILTFDLQELEPRFMILATDGLWDYFSNEEAVEFVLDRLSEPHFGAKSLVLQAYYRGSLDNITVMVVDFQSMRANQHEKTSRWYVLVSVCVLTSLLRISGVLVWAYIQDWYIYVYLIYK